MPAENGPEEICQIAASSKPQQGFVLGHGIPDDAANNCMHIHNNRSQHHTKIHACAHLHTHTQTHTHTHTHTRTHTHTPSRAFMMGMAHQTSKRVAQGRKQTTSKTSGLLTKAATSCPRRGYNAMKGPRTTSVISRPAT